MTTEIGLFKQPQVMVGAIVSCLNQLVEQTAGTSTDQQSVFNLKSAPTISISDYVARIVKYMNASLSVYIYALMLLDRAQEYNPEFVIHKKNIHRLLLVSSLVAAKYLDDLYYKNSFYATVGGVTLKVLNQLETEFLTLLNFNCHFERQTFDAYLERLELFIEINQREQLQKQNLVTPKRQQPQQEYKDHSQQQSKTEYMVREVPVRSCQNGGG